MTMYRIKVKNEITGTIYYEYGFSKWMMARIYYLFNKIDDKYYHLYKILDICILCFSWETFKKCLTNTMTLVTIE